MTDTLSHVDKNGQPTMVNVGDKAVTKRTARAESRIQIPPEIAALCQGNEIQSKKGPVFQTAIIAGTMAAKRTSELIPMCHPLALEDCKIRIEANDACEIVVTCSASIHHKTGVEMEALTGACVAALTIYDMLKAMSHDIVIAKTRLLEKTGGKSDYSSS